MFTRLALTALTGMSGRLLRRPRSWARRREVAASTATTAESDVPLSPTTAGQSQPAAQVGAATVAPGHRRPRGNAPLLAAIAARNLPILGVIGTLATLLLAVGAVRGELPYVGPFESASPAWAVAMVTIFLLGGLSPLESAAVASRRLGAIGWVESARALRDRE